MKTHLDKSISHKPLLKKKNLISVYSILCVVILILSSASASFIVNIVDHNTQIEIRNNEIFIEKEEPDAMFFPDITTDKDPIFIGNTGYEPCYGYVGGIINSANGNLFISQTDMSVNARGFNIEIIRSYNSFNQNHSSGFGYGWTFNYNTYVIDYLEYVIWVDGDGSFHNFTHVGGGIYSAPPGVHFRLRKHGDNSYSLSARSGMKYRFDEYGILTYMYDINGNKLSFSYDGAKLIRVEDDSGLYIDISYNAVNKIKSIRNPLGHFVNYSYDQFNNLIRLIDPLGYSVWFQYYCCHRLGTIIDRVNNTVIISYDDSGKRVVDIRNSMYDEADQSHDNAFLIYLVLYDYDNDTVFFLDANNYPTRVKINDVGNLIEINDALNQTTFASWENNMITSITDPNGNTNRYEYDSYSNPIKRINPFGYETLYNWSIKDSTDQYLISLTDSINVEYTRGPQVQLFNDSLTSPINSSWALSSNWGPTWLDFHSAPNSYACKFLDPILNYGQGWDETMDSPGIILSGYIDAELTFWHRGDFEDDATIHDGGNIKVSTDGRNTWNLMTPDDGYDGKIAYSWGANPLEVERAFGYSFGWKKETVDLTSYVGMADNVSIRFEMGTNMNPTMDQGWFIDDVIVNAYTAVPQYIITSFSYDVNGNLLSVNDATGNSSSYVYDSYGNRPTTPDFRGYITAFEYDLYGN